MRKQKLIVWHYNLLLFWNGGTKFVHTIASALSKKYRVIIIANSVDEAVMKKFVDAGIEVQVNYRWPKNIYIHRLLMPIGILIDAVRSLSLMRRANYVVATAFPSHIVCALASVVGGIKFSYYCFEPTVMFFDKGFLQEKKGLEKIQWQIAAKLYGSMDIWAIKKAESVLTLTNTMVKQIKKTYGVRAVPTQVGVDIDFFCPRTKTWYEKKYPGRLIVAHSTDYQPEKRLDAVITSISKIRGMFPNILLLVTSTNPDSPNRLEYEKMILKMGLTNKVKLLGFIDYEKIPELYSVAKCYISTASGWQYGVTSSNLPVKEAMACGTPVIRAPVSNEDVEEGVSGFMVDPDDSDLLAEKIKYLLDNKKMAEKMGESARKKIKQSFLWEQVISCFERNLVRNYHD